MILIVDVPLSTIRASPHRPVAVLGPYTASCTRVPGLVSSKLGVWPASAAKVKPANWLASIRPLPVSPYCSTPRVLKLVLKAPLSPSMTPCPLGGRSDRWHFAWLHNQTGRKASKMVRTNQGTTSRARCNCVASFMPMKMLNLLVIRAELY